MSVELDFRSLFEDALRETGRDLSVGLAEVSQYAAQRAAHLATLAGDPGFDEALRAERDAVALYAGLETVAQADAADARLVGVIQGGLAFAARLLSPA